MQSWPPPVSDTAESWPPAAFGLPARATGVAAEAAGLLRWERPVRSAAVCGAGFALYAAVALAGCTLVTLLCRATQIAVCCGLLRRLATGEPQPTPQESLHQWQLRVAGLCEAVRPHAHALCTAAARVAGWEEPRLSLACCAALLAVALLGSVLGDLELLLLGWLGAFALAPLRERYGDRIQAAAAAAERRCRAAARACARRWQELARRVFPAKAPPPA
eukprot:TRINITY_DN24473_c0_g1_i1.p1 TRINITY_DN24473_c0_g1~~TRINITY_DN24473_c0_g1_i1.p1  ORF type:complete len:247 (+),score=58.88 TRINITY_DN24473_c0_g1_i1:87-743(+)